MIHNAPTPTNTMYTRIHPALLPAAGGRVVHADRLLDLLLVASAGARQQPGVSAIGRVWRLGRTDPSIMDKIISSADYLLLNSPLFEPNRTLSKSPHCQLLGHHCLVLLLLHRAPLRQALHLGSGRRLARRLPVRRPHVLGGWVGGGVCMVRKFGDS